MVGLFSPLNFHLICFLNQMTAEVLDFQLSFLLFLCHFARTIFVGCYPIGLKFSLV